MIKQKRKEKAGKWEVPLPKVKAVSDSEVFRVVKTGKTKSKIRFNLPLFPLFISDKIIKEKHGNVWSQKLVLLEKVSHVNHQNSSVSFDQWVSVSIKLMLHILN
jgi:ribosome biogenesis protein NSA2